MDFKFIEDNIEKIKNPDNINIIKTARLRSKDYLEAKIYNGPAIPLTNPMRPISYPFEPIFWLSRELGRFYFEDFGIIFNNQVAINKKHLEKLFYVDTDKNSKRFQLYAQFDDGNLVFIARPLKKYFFKELQPELEQKFAMKVQEETNFELDNDVVKS